MKPFLFILACGVLAFVWARERISAARLEDECAALRQRPHDIADLQRERERLRSLQPDAAGFAELRRAAAERARLQAALDAAEATRLTPEPPLPLGEWTTAPTWKNRGQTTPRAAIETALWAAAGGDVAAFKQVCLFTDAARTAAETLRGRLPPETLDLYPSAEDLIAAFTIKRIPFGEAQIVLCLQNGPDEATVGILTRGPTSGAAATASQLGPREDQRTAIAYLTLNRIGNAWRIVVSPPTIGKIARELGYAEPTHGPTGSPLWRKPQLRVESLARDGERPCVASPMFCFAGSER